jgi:hypothetical protein
MVITPCARNAAPFSISRCQNQTDTPYPSASKPLTSKPQLYLGEYGTFKLTFFVVVSRQPHRSAPSSRLFASSQGTKSPVVHPLSIQQVTKCFFRNSFVLKTIHLSWGGVRVRVATALPWGILVSFMVHLSCRGSCRPVHRTAKRSNRGFPARTISSLGQRHFQRIGRPSAGASSKGLEPGRGWHCRSHRKGPVSCPRFRGNFPRLRCRQPTYRNDYNKKTVLPSRSAFPF